MTELPGADDVEPDEPVPTGQPDDVANHDARGLDLASLIAHSAQGRRPARRRAKPTQRPTGPTFSGARDDERDPRPLGDALQRLTSERGWSTEISAHVLLGRWATLVGPVNAEHSRPESYEGGVLTVRADSTAWASSLRLLAAQLVARLNDELGDGAVTRVVVKGPDAPSWKHGPRAVRDGRGPRDTYG